MTIVKFFFISLLQWIILTALKVAYFRELVFSGVTLDYAYWIVTIIAVIALVRRLGVVNYFEAIFILILWFIGDLLLDLVITSGIVGLSMFSRWQLWAGYFLMMLFIFSCHKKRHVAIRKGVYVDPRGHH